MTDQRPRMVTRIAWATAMDFRGAPFTKADFKERYAVAAASRGRFPSDPDTWASMGLKALRDRGWVTFHPKPRPGHWTFDLPDTPTNLNLTDQPTERG